MAHDSPLRVDSRLSGEGKRLKRKRPVGRGLPVQTLALTVSCVWTTLDADVPQADLNSLTRIREEPKGVLLEFLRIAPASPPVGIGIVRLRIAAGFS
jgi:hypothetical protein